MYTYVKSVVLDRSLGAQWTEAQLSTTSVFNIYNLFSKVVHVVTHPLFTYDLYIDFTALKTQYSGYEGTLEEWFIEIDDTTLPMLDALPTSTIKYVQYSDAIRAGYTVHLGQIGVEVPSNFPKKDLKDVYLTRPNTTTDVTLLHTKALTTVNGFLHLTDTNGEKLWIKDAAKSMHHSKLNHVGIISFMSLGNIKKIPITDLMMTSEIEDRPLKDRLDITLNEAIGNRSFMLSIGGYLQLPEEEVCWQTGERTISLCLDRLPYVERYYESKEYLDLSSLDLEEDATNPSAVDVDQLKSDEVIRKYLQLSQSFVILADIPNLTFRRIYLRRSDLPGMYISTQDPKFPQITGYGKFSEYWKSLEDGLWSVHIIDGKVSNYVLSYRTHEELKTLNDHKLPGRTYHHDRGYLLELGGYA